MRGKLICLEGGDGAGKATQSKLLAERLNGHRIAFPRYETPVGAEILANLKSELVTAYLSRFATNEEFTSALVRQALFTFDRYLATAEIEAKLAAGIHVVLDRYWLSGVIFGASDGLDAKMLEAVHQRLPQPDLWLLLDVSPEESIKRRPERRDMYEKDTKAAWRRREYLEFFNINDFSQWRILNGVGTVGEIHDMIVEHVCGRFGIDKIEDLNKGAE